jgi:hypothetical protein
VRYEGKVGTVASLEKKRHTSDESEHSGMGLRIEKTDRDLESTSDDAESVKKDLLAVDLVCLSVQEIGDYAAGRTEHGVEETEHGSPASSTSLAEQLEVLVVVASEDGVDREFGPKAAEVAEGKDGYLRAEDDAHSFFEGDFDDNFSFGGAEHFLLTQSGFVIERAVFGSCDIGFFVQRLLVTICGCVHTTCLLVSDGAGNVDEGIRSANSVSLDVLLDGKVTLRPFTGRGVRAEDEHSNGDSGDEYEWYDKRHSPCQVRSQVLVLDEGIKDSRHDKVSDSTTRVAPPRCEGVGGPNNVFVEECS